MKIDWSTIFDNFGVKTVAANDKAKAAYVPNEQQKEALAAAGRSPAARAVFQIDILFDPDVASVPASYYDSVRAGSGREPEARMGRGIVRWAAVGDQIVIGNKGQRVMAAKVRAAQIPAGDLGRELARKGNRERIMEKAAQATGKPARKKRTVSDFARSPYVVAAAILRAAGRCETPACTRKLFRRDDGSRFLEVHHITPLAEGGDDTIANAAALCPACHRELHHGRKRVARRALLAAEIAAKPLA